MEAEIRPSSQAFSAYRLTGDAMIKIIYTESAGAKPFLASADEYLSAERLEHFNRLKIESDRLDCLAVALLLKSCGFDKSQLFKDENGCPKLKSDEYISISHSGGIAAAALSPNPIGLDIQEHTRRKFLSVAKIVFCKSEIEWLKSSDNIEEDFFNLWCLKESYMKAMGLGFSLPPKSFWFDFSSENSKLFTDENESDSKWQFKCFKIEDLSVAVCFQGESGISITKIPLT